MNLSLRAALVLLLAPAALADEVLLNPVADNTLYENPAGSLSNGAGNSLFVGNTISDGLRRAVMRFDVAGAIPAGSTITSARLAVECTRAPIGASPVQHSLHRALTAWGEGTSIAGGAGGMGAPSTPDDATWIHTFFPGSLWATPGGDFDAAPSATMTIGPADPYEFVSPGLAVDVQAWLDGALPNHGWLMKDDAEIPGQARRYGSRENFPIIRPMLIVEFDPPTLGTNYCGPAVANSSGASAVMSATGSAVAADNSLMLTASSLPTNSAGYFLLSETQGFVVGAGGSAGNLCLGGSVGRFDAQVQFSGATGEISIPVDLTNVPSPTGGTAIVAGSTWNFQAWFRDAVGGQPTSNFSDGLTLQFQ
ncbi:MAG: DNRLRE domain-containing protein [Planctomycetota bacterium]